MSAKKYSHGEAFALMWYACRCGHRERIWNSRDGVTPFGGVRCPSCGKCGLDGGLSHVHFGNDECRPDHELVPGQRYWRDGNSSDAVAIIEKRIAIFAGRGQAVPRAVAKRLRDDAKNQTGEWQRGWPMLDQLPL